MSGAAILCLFFFGAALSPLLSWSTTWEGLQSINEINWKSSLEKGRELLLSVWLKVKRLKKPLAHMGRGPSSCFSDTLEKKQTAAFHFLC